MLQQLLQWQAKDDLECSYCENISPYCKHCNFSGKISSSNKKLWSEFLILSIICFFFIFSIIKEDGWQPNIFWPAIATATVLTALLGRAFTGPNDGDTKWEYDLSEFGRIFFALISALIPSFVGAIIFIDKVNPESLLIAPGVYFGYICGFSYLWALTLIYYYRRIFSSK